MSHGPESEILIEMNRIGHAMEVRAIDTSDGLEVVFEAPATAARSDVEKVAIAKLAYVRRRHAGSSGRDEPDHGGKPPDGRGGIVA